MATILTTAANALKLLFGVAGLSFVAAMPVSLDLAAQVLNQIIAL